MDVKIKAIHFDISEKLVAFVNKKIDKITRRFEAINDVDVTLTLVKPETAMNKEARRSPYPRQCDHSHPRQPTLSKRLLMLLLTLSSLRLEKIKAKK